ncbi:C-C chemokine receptor type 1-like [Hydractinia symbiolongicarpus]|uniref:C-C chemokine receptor type 1-like n=1 Tax=Hydractinia symbiolongicarpus TaxID=13093 RepID=UPI0025512151|nr:C-C chemokine receptor type 1-like [Hydractinia symbiolongicarpus]
MNISSETNNVTSSLSNSLSTLDEALVGLFSLIFCVGVIGNSFVIYVFGAKYKDLRSKQEILILLLAVVDFIASIANPALFIYYTVTKYGRWDFSEAGCKIFPTIGPVATSWSQGIILIMALDRDRAIVTPLKNSFSSKTIYKAVAVALLLSMLSYFDYTWYLTSHGQKTCQGYGDHLLTYIIPRICSLLISDILFLIIFVATITRVYLILRRKDVMGFDEVTKKYRKEKNRRAMRLLLTMGTVFAFCIYPRDLYQLSYHVSLVIPPKMVFDQKLLNINAALKVFHTANSCVNVFIYAFIHPKMKLEIKRLSRRLTLCSRKKISSEIKRKPGLTSKTIRSAIENTRIRSSTENTILGSPTISKMALNLTVFTKNNDDVFENNNTRFTTTSVT